MIQNTNIHSWDYDTYLIIRSDLAINDGSLGLKGLSHLLPDLALDIELDDILR